MVREAAAALNERDAEVLDLQLRYELTPGEIGDVIGINRNAANQLCHRARKRFATAFGARMLWRGSRPGCARLEAELRSAGVATFGPDAVRLADRHASECDDCDEHRRTRLTPAALFSAVPVLAAPVAVRRVLTSTIASDGAPMHGGFPTGDRSQSVSSTPGSGTRPPERNPTTPADASDVPMGSSARRVVSVGVAAIVVAAVVGAVFLHRSGGDGDAALSGAASARRASVTTTAPLGALSAPPTAPSLTGGGAVGPSTTRPSDSATTTAGPPAVHLPVIEEVSLASADPQYGTWTLGPDSPLLTWRVSGADEVKVWIYFDDGGTGTRRLRLLSSAPSGSSRVCPGDSPTPSTCSAPNGYYTFVVEATNRAGSARSADQGTPPGFRVYPPIL